MLQVPRKYTHSYAPVLHVDQLETSILGLRLLLEDSHFTDGTILLRCTATVAALDIRSDQDFLQMEPRPMEPLVLAQRNSHVYGVSCSFRPFVRPVVTPIVLLTHMHT